MVIIDWPEHANQEPAPTFIRTFFGAIFCDDTGVSATDREGMFRALADDSRYVERGEQEFFVDFLRRGQHCFGRLMLLASGRLAYASHPGRGPEPGDRVAILHGLNVPCLLRKSEDGKGWLHVTGLYVDGMMYGEEVD
ncbi:hypothetical protein E8E11_010042 [Didymella keratinophila]|nr:hypothetical protein E8E11_010042 [Didymella keratinophila]